MFTPGCESQLLVAVDGSRQSEALQREVSSRIRAGSGDLISLRPAWFGQRQEHGAFEVVVCVANRGGPEFREFVVAAGESDEARLRRALDARTTVWCVFGKLPSCFRTGYGGKVHLSAQIEVRPGVKKPVAWACESQSGRWFDGVDLKDE